MQKKSLVTQYPYLDGLRALLLVWVLFVHAPRDTVPDWLRTVHHEWTFGVDGFLAISGFLVMRSLEQCLHVARERKLSDWTGIKEFLIRRVSRIVPPYYAVLAGILVLALVTRGGLLQHLTDTWRAVLGFPLFYANYTIPGNWEGIPFLLQPFWSVSFQEQFYVLLALCGLAFRSTRTVARILFFGGLASMTLRLIIAFFFWQGQPRGWEYQSYLHLTLDSMTWGCLAWIYYDELGTLWSTRARAIVSTGAILISLAFVISIRTWWHDSLSTAVLACFKAPLLALCVRMLCEFNESRVARLLASPLPRGIGKVSYEIYLVHSTFYGLAEKSPRLQGPLIFPVIYLCSGITGYLFHRGFGEPSQRWAKAWLRRVFVQGTGAFIKIAASPPRS